MSEIFSDAAGNKYLGDCRWGNFDINYPSTSYLLSRGGTGLSNDLNTALSQIEANYSELVSQANLDSPPSSWSIYLRWSAANDLDSSATNKRIVWFSERFSTSYRMQPSLYNNTTTSLASSLVNTLIYPNGPSATSPSVPSQYSFCFSANSISIVRTEQTLPSSRPGLFMYTGMLESVNTNFDYYTAHNYRKYVLITGNIGGGAGVVHYVTSAKNCLNSGRATYEISCSDGQTPTSQWATDMWVYDNNEALGFPVIGRVPNMLLGVGTYTYLKPVKIVGSVFPDNGSPWYLPVGTYAGKTLLMRCYSSMPG